MNFKALSINYLKWPKSQNFYPNRLNLQETSRSELLNDLRKRLRDIRNGVQKNFYFLEKEDLRRRPAKGKWNVIEVFAHINIFQEYYNKQIANALERAPEVEHDEVKISWLGKKFVKSMQPRDGKIPMPMPTFAKADPLKRAKKGIIIKEGVVFQDFIADLEEMEELMIQSYDRDITQVKIKTFLPFIKLHLADAFMFNLAHTERHILQAERVLGKAD